MTRAIPWVAMGWCLWTGTAGAQEPPPEWAVDPETPHVLAVAAPLEWRAEAAEQFDDDELAVEELAEEEEAAGVAEPVVRLAPEVHVYAEDPVTFYAARVRGIARGLARRGVAVPERL